MDINQLVDLFDDNVAEIIGFIENLTTYTVRERPDYFTLWSEKEFYNRFRLKKDTVRNIVEEIKEYLAHDIMK